MKHRQSQLPHKSISIIGNHTFWGVLVITLSLIGPYNSMAHDFPFEPGQEKVRKIYSPKNYQWKIAHRTEFKGSYKTKNAYLSTIKKRNANNSESLYSQRCITDFVLLAIDPADTKVRVIGTYFPIDESGYFRLSVEKLECRLENSDGNAVFAFKKGHPHSASIQTRAENNQTQHTRLRNKINQFTEWTNRNYILFAQTRNSSHIYTFEGDRFDGNLALDTGLFNGAFINFQIPFGKGYQADQWTQNINALQIPQPMFMQSDPLFGPTRVPAPANQAPVTLKRLSGGMSELSSEQSYRWEDSLNNGLGFEAVRAQFIFAPEPDFG